MLKGYLEDLEVEVEECPLAKDLAEVIYITGGRVVICLDEGRSEPIRMYSLGHGFAHAIDYALEDVIPGYQANAEECAPGNAVHRHAERFSANLLMPSAAFRVKALRSCLWVPDLEDWYKVSPVAAALRIPECCSEVLAMAWFQPGANEPAWSSGWGSPSAPPPGSAPHSIRRDGNGHLVLVERFGTLWDPQVVTFTLGPEWRKSTGILQLDAGDVQRAWPVESDGTELCVNVAAGS